MGKKRKVTNKEITESINSAIVPLKENQLVFKKPEVYVELFKRKRAGKETFGIRIWFLGKIILTSYSVFNAKERVQTEFDELVEGLIDGERKIEI